MFQTYVIEEIKTHFMFNTFFPENPSVYELMWKNVGQPDRSHRTNIMLRRKDALCMPDN
jgi:hypothetical protein